MNTATCKMSKFLKFKKAGFTKNEAFKLATKTEKIGLKDESVKLMSIGTSLPAIALVGVEIRNLIDFAMYNVHFTQELFTFVIVAWCVYNILRIIMEHLKDEDFQKMFKEILEQVTLGAISLIMVHYTPVIFQFLIKAEESFTAFGSKMNF